MTSVLDPTRWPTSACTAGVHSVCPLPDRCSCACHPDAAARPSRPPAAGLGRTGTAGSTTPALQTAEPAPPPEAVDPPAVPSRGRRP